MRLLIQRVSDAHITINGSKPKKIGKGVVALLGISHTDTRNEIDYLVEKLVNLRIFEDAEGKMNLSPLDIQGAIMLVSQFTLYGDCKKGRRPSFTDAAPPQIAIPLYEMFIEQLKRHPLTIVTGEFGADMKIALTNDGPVTLMLEK